VFVETTRSDFSTSKYTQFLKNLGVLGVGLWELELDDSIGEFFKYGQ
jgi:hypothetical protein